MEPFSSLKNNSRRLFLLVLFVVLLRLAYPPFDLGWVAWFALVPWLMALDGLSPRRALWWGFWSATAFSATLFYWFVFMGSNAGIPVFLSILATVGLVVYLGVYWGAFAWLYVRTGSLTSVSRFVFLPAAWVSLELLRDRLFSGFGWATLGASQYKILPLIQIADITGVFGVSFWVLATNLLVKEILSLAWPAEPGIKTRRLSLVSVFVWLGLTVLVFLCGMRTVVYKPGAQVIKIAVIQPNIPQIEKWDVDAWPDILEKLKSLTLRVAAEKPDLVVWPETSFPGLIVDGRAEGWEELKDFVRRELRIPLLFGAVVHEGADYYNSGILLSAQAEELAEHHKLHLVPFGEYLPLRKAIPGLAALVPIEDFTAGTKPTLFPVTQKKPERVLEKRQAGDSSIELEKEFSGRYFSVLICFEDTLATVARRLVDGGAAFLVNITNDAWFQPSPAPAFHLQAAVFQAVSNRRYLVRAANNGISGFITPNGEILPGAVGIDQTGYQVHEVVTNTERSFYTRRGDVFASLCLLVFLSGIIIIKKNGRREGILYN